MGLLNQTSSSRLMAVNHSCSCGYSDTSLTALNARGFIGPQDTVAMPPLWENDFTISSQRAFNNRRIFSGPSRYGSVSIVVRNSEGIELGTNAFAVRLFFLFLHRQRSTSWQEQYMLTGPIFNLYQLAFCSEHPRPGLVICITLVPSDTREPSTRVAKPIWPWRSFVSRNT